MLLIISIIVKCVSSVRTALGNKKSSDLLKIRGFFILKIANNRYLFFPSYPHFT